MSLTTNLIPDDGSSGGSPYTEVVYADEAARDLDTAQEAGTLAVINGKAVSVWNGTAWIDYNASATSTFTAATPFAGGFPELVKTRNLADRAKDGALRPRDHVDYTLADPVLLTNAVNQTMLKARALNKGIFIEDDLSIYGLFMRNFVPIYGEGGAMVLTAAAERTGLAASNPWRVEQWTGTCNRANGSRIIENVSVINGASQAADLKVGNIIIFNDDTRRTEYYICEVDTEANTAVIQDSMLRVPSYTNGTGSAFRTFRPHGFVEAERTAPAASNGIRASHMSSIRFSTLNMYDGWALFCQGIDRNGNFLNADRQAGDSGGLFNTALEKINIDCRGKAMNFRGSAEKFNAVLPNQFIDLGNIEVEGFDGQNNPMVSFTGQTNQFSQNGFLRMGAAQDIAATDGCTFFFGHDPVLVETNLAAGGTSTQGTNPVVPQQIHLEGSTTIQKRKYGIYVHGGRNLRFGAIYNEKCDETAYVRGVSSQTRGDLYIGNINFGTESVPAPITSGGIVDDFGILTVGFARSAQPNTDDDFFERRGTGIIRYESPLYIDQKFENYGNPVGTKDIYAGVYDMPIENANIQGLGNSQFALRIFGQEAHLHNVTVQIHQVDVFLAPLEEVHCYQKTGSITFSNARNIELPNGVSTYTVSQGDKYVLRRITRNANRAAQLELIPSTTSQVYPFKVDFAGSIPGAAKRFFTIEAPRAGSIKKVSVITGGGTGTLQVRINDVAATTASAITASTTEQTIDFTGNNTFAAGAKIDALITSPSGLSDVFVEIIT